MPKLTELTVGDAFYSGRIHNIFPIGPYMAIVETARMFVPFIDGVAIGMNCYTFEQALAALVTKISGYEEAYSFVCRMLELHGEDKNG